MSVKNIGLMIFLFLFGPMIAYAGSVEIQCFLTPETGYIGDLFTYEVVLTKEAGVVLDVTPEFDPALELVTASSTFGDHKEQTVKYTYIFRSFEPGEYTIAPPKITTSEGQRVEHSGTEVLLTVESLLTDEIDDVMDIKPQGAEGFTLKQSLTIAAGVLACLLGLYLFFRLRKPRAQIQQEESLPAHVIAYRVLDELRKQELVKQGRIQEYYVRLSACLRAYVEGRFALKVMEMTTEEFLNNLQGASFLERNQKKTLDRFLRHCDLVKFAGYQPKEEEAFRAYDLCKAFIDETRDESSDL